MVVVDEDSARPESPSLTGARIWARLNLQLTLTSDFWSSTANHHFSLHSHTDRDDVACSRPRDELVLSCCSLF